MMSRRHALLSAALAWGGWPGPATAASLGLQMLNLPEPMAQLAAGGAGGQFETRASGLFGISTSGRLYALSTAADTAVPLGEGLDATVPLAVGHGRIAARRSDGALWVLQGTQAAVSPAHTLATEAGLLNLPLALIGVSPDGGQHRLVRLEPSGPGHWGVVSSSAMAVLPDARPLQADLQGSGDGGHVVVLAGPDGARYRHGVLGDSIEATRLVLLERHSLRLMRELQLPAPHVFEDIAPRRVALGGQSGQDRTNAAGGAGGAFGLLTIQAGPQGAQLVLVDADPSNPAALRVAARGAALGTAHRWMSPTAAQGHWLAVHTPHIGGVLHAYHREDERLVARRIMSGVSNHRIGSRWLDTSSWLGQRLLMPDQSGRSLLLLNGQADWKVQAEQRVPGRVAATIALPSPGGAAVLLEDGRVLAGTVPG